jgi:hypothetical protein
MHDVFMLLSKNRRTKRCAITRKGFRGQEDGAVDNRRWKGGRL